MLRYQSVPNRPVVPVPNLSGPREQINTLGHLSKSPCNLHWYAACQFSFVTLHGLFLFLSLFPHRDKGSGKTVMWSIADWEENYDVESRWSSQTKNIFCQAFFAPIFKVSWHTCHSHEAQNHRLRNLMFSLSLQLVAVQTTVFASLPITKSHSVLEAETRHKKH